MNKSFQLQKKKNNNNKKKKKKKKKKVVQENKIMSLTVTVFSLFAFNSLSNTLASIGQSLA